MGVKKITYYLASLSAVFFKQFFLGLLYSIFIKIYILKHS